MGFLVLKSEKNTLGLLFFLDLVDVIQVLVVVGAREKGTEEGVELVWSRWRCCLSRGGGVGCGIDIIV